MFFSSATQADFTPSVMRYLATVESGKKPDLREAISRVVQNVSPGTPVTIVSTRDLSEQEQESLLVIDPNESSEASWQKVKHRLRWLSYNSQQFKSLFSAGDPYFEHQLKELKEDVPDKPQDKPNREASSVST